MSITKLIEIWDNIAFLIYDIYARLKYSLLYFKLKKHLKKNRSLKNKHYNKRCFIVLNGPSLNNYDLSKLKDEVVLVTNHFYKSNKYLDTYPSYYLITDNHFFNNKVNNHANEDVKNLLDSRKHNMKFIINYNFIKFQRNLVDENVFLTYSKHMPRKKRIISELHTLSSNFITVSLYAINAAIYMGFKEIYLLGYDFEPGILQHFYKNSKSEEIFKSEKIKQTEKDSVCGKYWQYTQAHYQNYYMNKHAFKKGIKIYNCNKDSYVKAYDFYEFEKIFKAERDQKL
jgi:hypothetical protein